MTSACDCWRRRGSAGWPSASTPCPRSCPSALSWTVTRSSFASLRDPCSIPGRVERSWPSKLIGWIWEPVRGALSPLGRPDTSPIPRSSRGHRGCHSGPGRPCRLSGWSPCSLSCCADDGSRAAQLVRPGRHVLGAWHSALAPLQARTSMMKEPPVSEHGWTSCVFHASPDRANPTPRPPSRTTHLEAVGPQVRDFRHWRRSPGRLTMMGFDPCERAPSEGSGR